jgi:tetratricopeptide (TPR) repeat protein
MGEVYISANQAEKGIALWDKSLQIRKGLNNPLLVNILLDKIGTIYGDNRLFPQALSYFEQFDLGIGEESDKGIMNMKLGITYFYLQKYDKALTHLNQANKFLKNEVRIYFNRGLTLEKLHRYEEALQDFDTAMSIAKDDPHVLYNRAFCLYRLKRYKEAVEEINKYLTKIDKDKDIDALLIRCLCYLNLKQIAKAEADLKQLEQSDKSTAYVFIAKAALAAVSGDQEQAINQIEKAVNIGFQSKYEIENEDVFKGLQSNVRFKQVLEKIK